MNGDEKSLDSIIKQGLTSWVRSGSIVATRPALSQASGLQIRRSYSLCS